MIRLPGFVPAVLVAGCVARPATPPPEPAVSGRFAASSRSSLGLDTLYPVQGELEGRYTVFPESVVLGNVRVNVRWRDRPHVRFPMRLRAITPVLAYAPAPDTAAGWYPTPDANARPVPFSQVVFAGDTTVLDSLRLVVLTRRITDLRSRAIATLLQVEYLEECGTPRVGGCGQRHYVLAIVRLSVPEALPHD